MTSISNYYSFGNEDGYGVFFNNDNKLCCLNCNTQIYRIDGDYGNCVRDCERHFKAIRKIQSTFNHLYGDSSDSYSDSDDSDTSSRNSAAGVPMTSGACARSAGSAASDTKNSTKNSARNSSAGGARYCAADGTGIYPYSIGDFEFFLNFFYPKDEKNLNSLSR